MTTALLALALLQPANFDPPSGANRALLEAVRDVRQKLAAGSFEEASRLASALPRTGIRMAWDDTGVPADRREAFAAARDRAIAAWRQGGLGIEVTVTKERPTIKVSFAPSLPKDPELNMAPAAAHLIAFVPGEAAVDGVLSLRRGDPPQSTEPANISNEVAYLIGAALGLERQPRPGGAMGRSDTLLAVPPSVAGPELALVQRILALCDALRQAAASKTKLPAPAQPSAFLDSRSLQIGEGMQFEPMGFSLGVTNRGDAPLSLRIIPDCSCFGFQNPGPIAPGQTTVVPFSVNTADFPGPLKKAIFIYTNDPEQGVIRVPVTGNVSPLFRWLRPGAGSLSDRAIVVPKAGRTETFLLTVHPKAPLPEITSVKVAGFPADAQFEKWEGMANDPEYGEPATQRRGYKISVRFRPSPIPGRLPITIEAATTSKEHPVLRAGFQAQSGIVATPNVIFFGQVPAAPQRAWLQLSRPGQAFRITKITTDSELFSTEQEPMAGGDIRIIVRFNGKALPGSFSANLIIHTDDTDQPTLTIPIRGTVK